MGTNPTFDSPQTTFDARRATSGRRSPLLRGHPLGAPQRGAVERPAVRFPVAEHLLASAPDDGPRHVEIIANEQGLNLLRSDVTQFASEISLLQAHDVVFYACSKTIQRLEERGVAVQLVPHAIADYTALDRVVLRMQEGWTYEKI